MEKEKLAEILSAFETWSPSVKLRFVKRNFSDFNHQVIGGTCPEKYVNVLQQLHTSNVGNREWRDIPIETES